MRNSKKLKPCPIPLCNSEADVNGKDWCSCSNPECVLHSAEIEVGAWQALPRQSEAATELFREMKQYIRVNTHVFQQDRLNEYLGKLGRTLNIMPQQPAPPPAMVWVAHNSDEPEGIAQIYPSKEAALLDRPGSRVSGPWFIYVDSSLQQGKSKKQELLPSPAKVRVLVSDQSGMLNAADYWVEVQPESDEECSQGWHRNIEVRGSTQQLSLCDDCQKPITGEQWTWCDECYHSYIPKEIKELQSERDEALEKIEHLNRSMDELVRIRNKGAEELVNTINFNVDLREKAEAERNKAVREQAGLTEAIWSHLETITQLKDKIHKMEACIGEAVDRMSKYHDVGVPASSLVPGWLLLLHSATNGMWEDGQTREEMSNEITKWKDDAYAAGKVAREAVARLSKSEAKLKYEKAHCIEVGVANKRLFGRLAALEAAVVTVVRDMEARSMDISYHATRQAVEEEIGQWASTLRSATKGTGREPAAQLPTEVWVVIWDQPGWHDVEVYTTEKAGYERANDGENTGHVQIRRCTIQGTTPTATKGTVTAETVPAKVWVNDLNQYDVDDLPRAVFWTAKQASESCRGGMAFGIPVIGTPPPPNSIPTDCSDCRKEIEPGDVWPLCGSCYKATAVSPPPKSRPSEEGFLSPREDDQPMPFTAPPPGASQTLVISGKTGRSEVKLNGELISESEPLPTKIWVAKYRDDSTPRLGYTKEDALSPMPDEDWDAALQPIHGIPLPVPSNKSNNTCPACADPNNEKIDHTCRPTLYEMVEEIYAALPDLAREADLDDVPRHKNSPVSPSSKLSWELQKADAACQEGLTFNAIRLVVDWCIGHEKRHRK